MQDETAGPTEERLNHAGEFHHLAGRGKSNLRYTMLDDTLGRSLMRRKISPEEYSALRLYAYHWRAGGLGGALQSVDLDRIHAVDLSNVTGLPKTEAQADHRIAYYSAGNAIGMKLRWIADQIACYDRSLGEIGQLLAYRSACHGREKAAEWLSEAGYRLGRFWSER